MTTAPTPEDQPAALRHADWLDMADKRYCMPKLHHAADELNETGADEMPLSGARVCLMCESE